MAMREKGTPLREIRRVIDGKYRGTPTPTPYPNG
jgi:hypothetical protein